MKESFIFGICMGIITGAVLVYTCPQAKEIMKKGEKVLKDAEKSIKEQCKAE